MASELKLTMLPGAAPVFGQVATAFVGGTYSMVGLAFVNPADNNLLFSNCSFGCAELFHSTWTLTADTSSQPWPVLALTQDGAPVAAYRNRLEQLVLTVCNDAACHAPVTTKLDDSASYPSLVMVDNAPVLTAYAEANQVLYFYRCSDATCTSFRRVALSSLSNSRFHSLDCDPATSLPRFVVLDDRVTTNNILYLGECVDPLCDPDRVVYHLIARGHLHGQDCVIRVHGNTSFMVYHDAAALELWLAVCTETPCGTPIISRIATNTVRIIIVVLASMGMLRT